MQTYLPLIVDSIVDGLDACARNFSPPPLKYNLRLGKCSIFSARTIDQRQKNFVPEDRESSLFSFLAV